MASYVFETLRLLSSSLRSWDEVSLFAHQKAGFSLAGEIHAGPICLLAGLVILMVVVWRSSRKQDTPRDYFLAGRNIGKVQPGPGARTCPRGQ